MTSTTAPQDPIVALDVSPGKEIATDTTKALREGKIATGFAPMIESASWTAGVYIYDILLGGTWCTGTIVSTSHIVKYRGLRYMECKFLPGQLPPNTFSWEFSATCVHNLT